MKTLIVYATNHGCTEKIAEQMKDYLGGDVTLKNLKKESVPSPELYSRVIVGGSIHAGQVQKKVKEFCRANSALLLQKELGLFICCMEEGEVAQKQLENAYPEELLENAKASAFFGGAFDFDRMNFLEKMVVKKVAQVRQSTSKVDSEEVRKFSKRMDRVFNPFLFLV
ncbi:menaquinone-dependent protoporphyrinogen oxidase [Mariniphaga anaerophila]|uniref:Menaquinone-dependent protoporphyrinogen oxidase n=1 Tax=Mariniphaga anaerophila TaxID=1484053 RepID=A0A1M5CJ60_9BACT|nr:flavodoxin domain-containing protein [Mariniphaga anaerophila]SHF54730.1 menaquinone-dependent protoporphyrinogen oxidase [Mariniphaga anaerophila]